MRKKNVLAIIPIREKDIKDPVSLQKIKGKTLLEHTIGHAQKSKYVNNIIVSSNSRKVIDNVRKLGVKTQYERPEFLNGKNISLDQVLQHAAKWFVENAPYKPDVVVLLEVTHPFRTPSIIDKTVQTVLSTGLDTVFVSYEDHRNYWRITPDNGLERIGEEGYKPREKHLPIYREVSGVACATRLDFVLDGTRLGERVGMIPVNDSKTVFDIHDEGEILS